MVNLTRSSEEFFHLQQCMEDLNLAWSILKEIQRKRPRGNLLVASFRYALVEYSKSFKKSFSSDRTKRFMLDDQWVPKIYFKLHEEILNQRDTFLAHSDIAKRDPHVFFDTIGSSRKLLFSRNYIHGLELYPRISEIVLLIEGTLDGLYEYTDSVEDRYVEATLQEILQIDPNFEK